MYSYNDEDWFNDSIEWYVSHDGSDILSEDLPFFTEIYTVFDSSSYSTFEQLANLSNISAQAYSVERPSIDTLVLTCRYTPGTPAVHSLALVTIVNGSAYLVAKIKRGVQSVPITNGVDRVFKFKLPYKIVGDTKVYPNISLRNKRYMGTPIGEEFVTTGEHHHNVDWGGEGARDSVPVLPQPSARYVASANYNIQDGYGGEYSYVYNEYGAPDPNSKVASITGKKVSSGSILPDLTDNPTSRIIDTVANILANIMEEYLMATNSIQILGHEIPTEASLVPSTGENYVLYVDKVAAANDRHLKAISSVDFRSWLVKRIDNSTANADISTDSCITLITSNVDVHRITLNKENSMAIFTNTISGNFADANGRITVSIGSVNKDLYPSESMLIFRGFDSGSSQVYNSFKISNTDYLRGLVKGSICFSAISLGTAGAASSNSPGIYYANFGGSTGIGIQGSIITDINASGKTITVGTVNTGTLTGLTSLTVNGNIVSTGSVTSTNGFYLSSNS